MKEFLLIIALVVLTSLATLQIKEAYDTYTMHPIEVQFKKLPYGEQLLLMALSLKAKKDVDEILQKKSKIKIEYDL